MMRKAIASLVGPWGAPAIVWLLRMTGRRAGVALLYHRIGEHQGDPTRELVPPLARAKFRRQLRHLRRHYELVPVERFLDAIASRTRGRRFPVCLTFDDDVPEHALYAAPELLASGAPATFFLCGSFLDGGEPFWWQHLQRIHDRSVPMERVLASLQLDIPARDLQAVADSMTALAPERRADADMALRQLAPGARDEAVLSAEQASELIAGGFGVGFHTRRHDSLPGLDDRALERALRDGRSELEKFARRRVDVIAYPHGRADRRVAEAARAAHFVLGFTTLRRVVTPDSDPLLAGRLTAPRGSLGEFAVGMLRSIVER